MGWLYKKDLKASALWTLVSGSALTRGLFFLGVSLASPSSQATLTRGEISKVGDATHLEFSGLSQWKYNLNTLGKGEVELVVPPFDLKTQTILQTWSGKYIRELNIDKNGPDGQYILKIKLNGSLVETFDYLTDEPSRLIVDFFQKPEVSKELETAEQKNKKPTPKNKKRARLIEPKGIKTKSGRAPSGELEPQVGIKNFRNRFINDDYPKRGLYDGGDPSYDRFRIDEKDIKESSILAASQNIYIRFPMLKMPSSELDEVLSARPDYVVKPENNQENKEARLLLTLYKNRRLGYFFKAYNYFKKTYPNSKYDEIVTHLAAELQFDRFRDEGNRISYEAAKSLYTYLLDKYPNSPLAERTEFVLGYAELERGNALPAIQRFQGIITKYPRSASLDQARRAQAAAYLIIRRYQDALNSLGRLEKTAKYKRFSREANYRLGDVYFHKKDFKRAIEAYAASLKDYPEYESTFPNAHFNMAESYFWRGNFKKALDHYIEFVSRFPNHPHGAYALTRIGENLEILGADQTQVIGAYLESYFRFQGAPGANVSRVRMLSQQMKGMKDKELKKVLADIDKIAEQTDLPRIREFVALMVADGFHRRENYQKAMDMLISYYQKNPTSADLTFFKKRILAEIAQVIVQKVENREFLPALKFYQDYKGTWLRQSPRLDIPYFQGRAYEQAGAFGEAHGIYKKTAEKLEAMRGTDELKAAMVSENLPTNDEVHLRLARTSEQMRKYKEASAYLKKIARPEDLSPKSRVERVIVAAEIAKARGQNDRAKGYLTQLEESWKEQSSLVAPVLLDLAELQLQDGELVDSIQSIEKIEEAHASEPVGDEMLIDSMIIKGKVLEKQGKKLAAVDNYIKLLNQYESKAPLSSIRYRAGGILYDQGDIKGAELIWNQLSPENDPMFASLAEERLKDAEWQGHYKRYIERIPAMSKKDSRSQ